jgi:hypothetical protein
VSDSTLKQKGAFDDSIRLNRRQRRKAKEGNTSLLRHFLKLIYLVNIDQKRSERKEKLETREK